MIVLSIIKSLLFHVERDLTVFNHSFWTTSMLYFLLFHVYRLIIVLNHNYSTIAFN